MLYNLIPILYVLSVVVNALQASKEAVLGENNAQIGMLDWGQGPALSWFTFAAANCPACNWTQHIAELTATPNAYEQW